MTTNLLTCIRLWWLRTPWISAERHLARQRRRMLRELGGRPRRADLLARRLPTLDRPV